MNEKLEQSEELEMLLEDGANAEELLVNQDSEDAGEAPKPDDDKPGDQGDDKPDDDASDTKPGEAPDKYFTSNFDGYENIDQVKSLAERGKLFTNEVEQEYNTLKEGGTKLESMSKEISDLKARQPFENPKYYQLDKLAKENPDKASVMQRYLFGNPSAEELIKLGMLLEHPDIFDKKPDSLERRFRKQYSALFTENEEGEIDKTSTEYLDALDDMEIDAKKVKERFDAEIEKVDIPKIKTEEEMKVEQVEFAKTWKGNFGKVKEGLKTLAINVLDEKDETKVVPFMDMEIPEDEQKALLNDAANHILTHRLEASDTGVEAVLEVAKKMYILNNIEKFATNIANKVATETGTKWRKKVNNPKPAGSEKSPTSPDAGQLEEGSEEYAFNQTMEGYG